MLQKKQVNQSKDKLKYIEIDKIKGNSEAEKLALFGTKSIRSWKDNDFKFKEVANPQNLITLHKGNPKFPFNEELKKFIYNWIDSNRPLGNVIKTWAIGIEMTKRYINLKDIKPRSFHKTV